MGADADEASAARHAALYTAESAVVLAQEHLMHAEDQHAEALAVLGHRAERVIWARQELESARRRRANVLAAGVIPPDLVS